MPRPSRTLSLVRAFLLCIPSLASAQASAGDAALAATRESASTLKVWITKSAEQMTESDFAFRPAPDVRSFGQLMAHIADRNYEFCAAARGEAPPAQAIETSHTGKERIERALNASFVYCDSAYARLVSPAGRETASLHGRTMPVASVLLYLSQHNALHYGNAITYLRLRGRVPPSTSSPLPGD
jgi:uncharacterized damage-inducible protein DinB